MARKFVRLLADVHCKWQGLSPIYRAYVNDELFAERTWIWTDCYLRECLQIEAEPGRYHIKFEKLTTSDLIMYFRLLGAYRVNTL